MDVMSGYIRSGQVVMLGLVRTCLVMIGQVKSG